MKNQQNKPEQAANAKNEKLRTKNNKYEHNFQPPIFSILE